MHVYYICLYDEIEKYVSQYGATRDIKQIECSSGHASSFIMTSMTTCPRISGIPLCWNIQGLKFLFATIYVRLKSTNFVHIKPHKACSAFTTTYIFLRLCVMAIKFYFQLKHCEI